MDLELFAEMQRRRIREISISEVRRRQLGIVSESVEVPVSPVGVRRELTAPEDAIKAAYRKLGIVYE